MTENSTTKYYTIEEIAKLLNVTERFIYRHLDEIPHYKLSRATYRFDLEEVKNWLVTKKEKVYK